MSRNPLGGRALGFFALGTLLVGPTRPPSLSSLEPVTHDADMSKIIMLSGLTQSKPYMPQSTDQSCHVLKSVVYGA